VTTAEIDEALGIFRRVLASTPREDVAPGI